MYKRQVGNLAFWPQQDIVEAMGASNKVAYNINKKLFHSGDTTETDEDGDLHEANPNPNGGQPPITSQEEPEPVSEGTDGSQVAQDDLDIIDIPNEDPHEQLGTSFGAPVNTMDGDPGQPLAPVTDPDLGPELKKDDGKVPDDARTSEYIEH